MARPSLEASVSAMAAVLRVVNDLAPATPGTPGTPVSLFEIAERASLNEAQVLRAIDKINYGCGDVSPQTLIDYDPDTKMITPWRISGAFEKPLRLTPDEARGICAALEAAGYTQNEVVEKIHGALPESSFTYCYQTQAVGSKYVRELTAAAREHKVVSLSYRGLGDTHTTTREVEPYSMHFDNTGEGVWYMHAWCRLVKDWRTFRLSRIESAQITDIEFEPRELDEANKPSWLAQTTEAILAVHNPCALVAAYDWRGLEKLSSPATKDWDRLSAQDKEQGGFIASVPWGQETPWLASALLLCGGEVEVLHPEELRDAVHKLACTSRMHIEEATK